MVRSRLMRSLWLCAAGALLAGFTNNYLAPGRPLARTPLSESRPSETKATPNLSHHDPLWSLSPPVSGFDQPAISVRTVPPAESIAPPPKTIQTITIRPGDGFLQPAGPSTVPRSMPRAVPETAGRGVFVQVSAQRTESEAITSFHALQRKFDALRSHSPMIRRVDVGGSPLYRVLVGPFEAHAQANALCNALKDQGGQCILQRLD